MSTPMIPAKIDQRQIVADLNAWGIRDYKIDAICGFSVGYVAQIKKGGVIDMSYTRAARLYNFWTSEKEARDAAALEPIHSAVVTST